MQVKWGSNYLIVGKTASEIFEGVKPTDRKQEEMKTNLSVKPL